MMTRDQRQDLSIKHYIKAGCNGSLVACTGFGKGVVGLKVVKLMRSFNIDRDVLVVVPSIPLKHQWEGLLASWGLARKSVVEVINTVVKRKWNTHLLIIDECHRYASDTFYEVFNAVKYHKILGLTATMNRLDRKHSLIKEKCPIFDTITTKEARDNGWVAEYLEFNLGVEMPAWDCRKYEKLETEYNGILNTFMHDFGLMSRCAQSYKPRLAEGIFYDSACSDTARRYGWIGNTPQEAYSAMIARRKEIWEGVGEVNPKMLYIRAINGMRLIRQMKEFIYQHENKASLALQIINLFPLQPTVVFSETTKMADEVSKMVNQHPLGGSMSYHTKMKRIKGPTGKLLTMKDSKAKVLEMFKDGTFRVISTARALNEGADFPDAVIGIRVAGNSSPTAHTQRRGRILRKKSDPNIVAIMVNLYLLGTKDEQWLTKSQGYDTEIHWVKDLAEIANITKSYLFGDTE